MPSSPPEGRGSGPAEAPDPLLTARHLSVAYGANLALDDLSFDLGPGSIASVIGPNGAGKSTLFRAILGLVALSAGSVVCHGRVAYVPQGDHARLDLPLTVFDVAMMGRIASGRWWRRLGTTDREAARSALERVDMSGHAGCQIGELSGGQRQRVMLARALARGGSVYILDEPFTGVDGTSEATILDVLSTLRESGATVLMSTHDLNQAAAISDQLLLLNRRLIAAGPPRDVFTPAVLRATYGGELFVADPAGGAPIGVFDDASHHHHAGDPHTGRHDGHPDHHHDA